jgi:hypothetical protein
MATTAPQTQYRQELVLGFEQRKSMLLQAVTNEAIIKGNTATFLITSSSGDSAVTRGTNGLIPYRSENMTQTSATLAEYHAPYRKTNFNIFQSQGDQRRSMQEASTAVINRQLDSLIIAELDSATNTTGTAATGSLALLMKSYAILGSNVALDGAVTAVITPAFHAYLLQTEAFSSVEYINRKPFENGLMQTFQWGNFDFIVHPNLTGKGTSLEKCYLFNKSAIGCAMDTKGLQVEIGYDAEMDYSFSRATFYGGAKLLQNSGVVQIKHDGSAYVAS